MFVRSVLLAIPLLAALAPAAVAQHGRVGPAPVYLPPPTFSQGLGPHVTPGPVGNYVAPYGGTAYGSLGNPGGIYSTYRGSYLNTPSFSPPTFGPPLRSGPLPAITDLFPGPVVNPAVPRMPAPTPPGPVVPVGEAK